MSNESKWSSTFQWWDNNPPGEVIQIPVSELIDYESTYTHMFNYLREKGWTREENKWKHSEPDRVFKSVQEAYEYQIYFLETIR